MNFAIKRWMSRYQEVKENLSTLAVIESKLTEMTKMGKCIQEFTGTRGTDRKTIYEFLEKEKGCYRLHFYADQSEFFHEACFCIDVQFLSGEEVDWKTNNLCSPERLCVEWLSNRKVYFKSPTISDAELYEKDAIKAGEKIIAKHKEDLLKALQDIIDKYKAQQDSKKDLFNKDYLEGEQE